MSAGAMPPAFSAAISRFILAAFPPRAALAVDAVVETPKVNCASSGTVVTIPVPWTVIVRCGAAVAVEPAATATAVAARSEIVHEGFIACHVPYAAARTCVTRCVFPSPVQWEHRNGCHNAGRGVS